MPRCRFIYGIFTLALSSPLGRRKSANVNLSTWANKNLDALLWVYVKSTEELGVRGKWRELFIDRLKDIIVIDVAWLSSHPCGVLYTLLVRTRRARLEEIRASMHVGEEAYLRLVPVPEEQQRLFLLGSRRVSDVA